MPKLKISAADMVAAAKARIEEISAGEAVSLTEVTFVDLRDIRERQREGFIPGSYHCPRGMAEFWVDPESPYFKEIFGEDRKFVFYCASGWRSALTVDTLRQMGFDAAHISEGFSGWKRAGGVVKSID